MESASRKRSIHSRVAIVVAYVFVAVSLQGCLDSLMGKSSGGQTQVLSEEQEAEKVKVENANANIAAAGEFDNGDKSYCDAEIKSTGDEFHDVVEFHAPNYVAFADHMFGDEFLRMPYCVQIDHKLVLTMEQFVENDPQLSELSHVEKGLKIDDLIQQAFYSVGAEWEARLHYECERQKAHQIAHMDTIRNVLQIPVSVSNLELQSEIVAFWEEQPMWQFFNSLRKVGCVRRYAEVCEPIIGGHSGANDHVHMMVQHVGGTTWFAERDPRDPDDDLGPVA